MGPAFTGTTVERTRHHNDCRDKNRCCKVPAPCF